MKTIKIKRSELVDVLIVALDGCIGTCWDIYVNTDGNVDCRHNTHNTNGWARIIYISDLDLIQYDGLCSDDDGFDCGGVAEWVVDETEWKPRSVGFYDVEGEYTKFDLELID